MTAFRNNAHVLRLNFKIIVFQLQELCSNRCVFNLEYICVHGLHFLLHIYWRFSKALRWSFEELTNWCDGQSITTASVDLTNYPFINEWALATSASLTSVTVALVAVQMAGSWFLVKGRDGKPQHRSFATLDSLRNVFYLLVTLPRKGRPQLHGCNLNGRFIIDTLEETPQSDWNGPSLLQAKRNHLAPLPAELSTQRPSSCPASRRRRTTPSGWSSSSSWSPSPSLSNQRPAAMLSEVAIFI